MIGDAAILRVAEREAGRFRAANPRAFAHHASATGWFQSVPFHWMKDWPSPVPIVAASAKDAMLTSIDGQTYDDFCLGDTASLFGHSPPALAEALAKQAGEGLSYMLPTERGAALSIRVKHETVENSAYTRTLAADVKNAEGTVLGAHSTRG